MDPESQPQPRRPEKRRRTDRVTAACDFCKVRKVKCDGSLPCGYCQRKKRADTCTFSGPKQKQASDDFFLVVGASPLSLAMSTELSRTWQRSRPLPKHSTTRHLANIVTVLAPRLYPSMAEQTAYLRWFRHALCDIQHTEGQTLTVVGTFHCKHASPQ